MPSAMPAWPKHSSETQAQADRLAKAAGVSLGPLVHLNDVSDESLADVINRQRMEMYSAANYADSQQPWQPQFEAEENEMASRKPDELEFRIGVVAAFALDAKSSDHSTANLQGTVK